MLPVVMSVTMRSVNYFKNVLHSKCFKKVIKNKLIKKYNNTQKYKNTQNTQNKLAMEYVIKSLQ